ncbi:little elongation complex subunit 1 [Lutzomyia longipalpis]|uniref:little elongation complex subunit 1 n=1 Tax=Lutzomyia longipalpis TaxID=7200 RepID=UPI00248342B8|nr:little elongation complex subunit 1 [Lutzomyia longipalpis]
MSENFALAALSADTQVLARTIANTDTLVRRLRKAQQENEELKNIVQTVQKTATKVNQLYLTEQEKCCRNEKLLRDLRDELRDTKEREQAHAHQIINMDRLHEQTVEEIRQSAGKVEKSQEKFFIQVTKELLRSVRLLMENDLMDGKAVQRMNTLRNKMAGYHFLKNALKEFPSLERKTSQRVRKTPVKVPRESLSDTESVDDGTFDECLERSLEKSLEKLPADSSSDSDTGYGTVFFEAAQLEDNMRLCSFQEIPSITTEKPSVKEVAVQTCPGSFCSRGTMTTSITVTRGTNTENHVKTASVGTLFPEFEVPGSYEKIFEEMIVDLPEFVNELPSAPMKDASTATEEAPERQFADAETLTDLYNVRKMIGYRKREVAATVAANVKVENLKMEPPSPRPNDEIPLLHPQFERVWSIMGQTLFAVLRNSTTDLTHSQYLNEAESIVKEILKEEIFKGDGAVNNFLPDIVDHPGVVLGNPIGLEVENPKEIEENIPLVEEEIMKKPQPVKRKSIVDLKSVKKIKLQRPREEEETKEEAQEGQNVQEKDQEEDFFEEEFNLDVIRAFYAHPLPLEPIDDLPEELLKPPEPQKEVPEEVQEDTAPNSMAETPNSVPETQEDPPKKPSRPSIMNFVLGQTFQRFSKAPNGEILGKCEMIIREYLQVEWVSGELVKYVEKMIVLKPEEQILFDAIAGIVEASLDQLVFNPFGSLAPLVPKTHQQIIIYCHTIAQNYPGGFLRRFQHAIERRIFTLTAEKLCLKKLINLTFLLIPLMDLQFEERQGKIPIRLFIFKCLYYFHHKAPPLIYMILKAFPDALPEAKDGEFHTMEPLLLALRCALANLPPLSNAETERVEYKKKELLQLLRQKYKYIPGSPSAEETTEILLKHLQQGNCSNIAHALTLVGKRMGVVWVETNLMQRHLIPRLNDLLLEPPAEGRNSQIVTVVTAISSLVKAFPNMKDPAEYHRIFSCVLESMAAYPHVQEAAIGAFLRLARFGMISVFSQIYQWRSRGPISRHLAAALETFVHRKPRKYWMALERQIK